MEWRIGVHLGDVLIEADDILGDGVNVAARLEGIAEPGGICISEDAFRQVRGKVDAEFLDIGEQALKNIARPLRVYRVRTERPLPSPPPQAGYGIHRNNMYNSMAYTLGDVVSGSHRCQPIPTGAHRLGSGRLVVAVPAAEPGDDPGQPR